MKTNFKIHTDGNGRWSNVAKSVRIIQLYLNHADTQNHYAEIHAVFHRQTWKPEQFGLIYTDRLFLKELCEQMQLSAGEIGYSEQGMQGDNYVSFDVGSRFFQSNAPFAKRLLEEWNKLRK